MDDARFLLEKGQRTNAAVYLAGYSVECILKALLIDSLPNKKQEGIISEFRKQGHGHNFDWLKHEYRKAGGGVPIGNPARFRNNKHVGNRPSL